MHRRVRQLLYGARRGLIECDNEQCTLNHVEGDAIALAVLQQLAPPLRPRGAVQRGQRRDAGVNGGATGRIIYNTLQRNTQSTNC